MFSGKKNNCSKDNDSSDNLIFIIETSFRIIKTK